MGYRVPRTSRPHAVGGHQVELHHAGFLIPESVVPNRVEPEPEWRGARSRRYQRSPWEAAPFARAHIVRPPRGRRWYARRGDRRRISAVYCLGRATGSKRPLTSAFRARVAQVQTRSEGKTKTMGESLPIEVRHGRDQEVVVAHWSGPAPGGTKRPLRPPATEPRRFSGSLGSWRMMRYDGIPDQAPTVGPEPTR